MYKKIEIRISWNFWRKLSNTSDISILVSSHSLLKRSLFFFIKCDGTFSKGVFFYCGERRNFLFMKERGLSSSVYPFDLWCLYVDIKRSRQSPWSIWKVTSTNQVQNWVKFVLLWFVCVWGRWYINLLFIMLV